MADLNDFIPDLAEQLANDPDIDTQLDAFMADEVVPEWRDNSPVDSGEYRDSVQVTKPTQNGKGQVGALDDKAHIIEYGTEKSPEFAPRAKTENHFNKEISL